MKCKALFLIFNFLVLFCLGQVITAQQKFILYSDVNQELITREKFREKALNPLFYPYSQIVGDTIFRRLNNTIEMGVVNAEEKATLFKILEKSGLDTTKNILIHYRDTLYGENQFPRIDSTMIFNTYHQRFNTFNRFLKNNLKCERNISNESIQVYHMFSFNKGFMKKSEVSFIKDPTNLIKRIFSSSSPYQKLWAVLLYTDGRFFCNYNVYSQHPFINWKQLLKDKGWNQTYIRYKYELLQL